MIVVRMQSTVIDPSATEWAPCGPRKGIVARQAGANCPTQAFPSLGYPVPPSSQLSYSLPPQALEGFKAMCSTEGIIPALEPAHAVYHTIQMAKVRSGRRREWRAAMMEGGEF